MNNRRRRAHVATYSGQMSYAYYLSLPLPNHRLLDFIVVRWPMARVTMFFLCFLRFLQRTLSLPWFDSGHYFLVFYLFCSFTIYLTEQLLCPNFLSVFSSFFIGPTGFHVAAFWVGRKIMLVLSKSCAGIR